MEHMSLPETTIDTPLGKLTLAATDNQHIYVECTEAEVCGKSLYFALHWSKINGQWTKNNKDGASSLYTSSKEKLRGAATVPQTKKILQVVEPVLHDFVNNNEEFLKQAQIAKVNNKVMRLERERQEALQTVAAIEAEIAELKASI